MKARIVRLDGMDDRNWSHAVLVSVWLDPAFTLANYAKGAVTDLSQSTTDLSESTTDLSWSATDSDLSESTTESVLVYWEPSMEFRRLLQYTYISCLVVKAIVLTKILDQWMLQISTSNGWMDWQKYPKNKKLIRIQQSKALGCISIWYIFSWRFDRFFLETYARSIESS